MVKLAIFDCGYVGLALAETFSKKKLFLTGTTRIHSRVKEMQKYCQNAVFLKTQDFEGIRFLVLDHDVIIVTVEAHKKEDYDQVYRKAAEKIRKAALELKTPKRLIYLSSTFVYGDHLGHWVDEDSKTLSKDKLGNILIETENIFLSLQKLGWSVCIFRAAEIYGPSREVSTKVKQYQKKILTGDGAIHTNMVHLKDVVQAIDYALKHKLEGIYNLVDEDHPTRKDMFDAVAKELKLKEIQWDKKAPLIKPGNKRVSNHKIKAAGYDFAYPHRVMA